MFHPDFICLPSADAQVLTVNQSIKFPWVETEAWARKLPVAFSVRCGFLNFISCRATALRVVSFSSASNLENKMSLAERLTEHAVTAAARRSHQ